MKNIHYRPHTTTSSKTFDQVLIKAKSDIDKLPEYEQKSLKEELKNGLGNLTTTNQLKMYIATYGDIHRQKLLMAFNKIPKKVWYDKKISIIDYGCGQCFAEMVLADFMKDHYINNDYISDFTLIEPSRISLAKGLDYLQNFFPFSNKKAYLGNVGDIQLNNISVKNHTIIHIFSNVLDIPTFQKENIASIINEDMSHNHILVCVSPFYQENGRGKLMDEFRGLLRAVRTEYKFEKHIDDWDKPFSCQIRIFVSSYY